MLREAKNLWRSEEQLQIASYKVKTRLTAETTSLSELMIQSPVHSVRMTGYTERITLAAKDLEGDRRNP